jgi:hypothetical protein
MIEDAEFLEGEEEARGTVLAFFEKLVGSSEVQQGFKVRLLMVGSGASESEVYAWDYEVDLDLPDFVDSIIEKAVEDSKHYRNAIKYAVRCFIGGKPRRMIFLLNRPKTSKEESDEFGGDEIESPTIKGIVQQNMRHTEFYAKENRHLSLLAVKASETIMRTYEQQIARLSKRVQELEAREEDVRSLQFARDLHLDKVKREEDRKAEAFQMLRGALPHLAQKFLAPAGGGPPLGTPGGPGGDAVADFLRPGGPQGPVEPSLDILHVRQDMLLDALFNTITPEQVQQLAGVLTPIQVSSILELHGLYQERQAASSQTGAYHDGAYHDGAPPHTPPRSAPAYGTRNTTDQPAADRLQEGPRAER